ncbi:hypothetical protein GCM10009678_74390 [Actinomadura kijaniata]|uniref:Uncharacterized protein n=1 Tax=Actinomadura namibiensis TaxID=182080 RepID=A0A7W3LRY9_ACTNM|nr:hypothetical protein [Actinomadura namibiensis]MBA8953183.1 hypothetical protein [Actinomadura namibiensis]
MAANTDVVVINPCPTFAERIRPHRLVGGSGDTVGYDHLIAALEEAR